MSYLANMSVFWLQFGKEYYWRSEGILQSYSEPSIVCGSCCFLGDALTYTCLHGKDWWFSLISYVIDHQHPLNVGCRRSRIKLFECWMLNVHSRLVLKVIVAYSWLQIIHSGYLLICCIWIIFFFHQRKFFWENFYQQSRKLSGEY